MDSGTYRSVREQLEAMRAKLLDLSLNNRMLNYRASKRIALAIVGEDSEQILRILVEEGKRMSFRGKPDPPRAPMEREMSTFDDDVSMERFREEAEAELDAYVGNPVMPFDQMDTKLDTEEIESVLQAKLRTIMREAHLANEELGVNTLFLTLGALQWSETEDRTYRAPLIFIPVQLEQLANGSIRVSHDGSDIGENLPLRAKLKEFNLKLPERKEEEALCQYFAEIEATVRSRQDWCVHRNAINLAFFNYEKYAMYADLGGDQWPENGKPWMAPEVVKLLGTGFEYAESPIRDDSHLDDARPVAEAFEVYDADSSQTLAMMRASEGLSIVVEGPPGTGKSQTITNIIAEAVAKGKTVLFVAAKRAALEVVKRRLTEAELEDLFLDLHDKLTNRKAFYAELKRTVSRRHNLTPDQVRVLRLSELRDRLNRHSEDVNATMDQFSISPFDAMSQLARLPKEASEDREGRIDFRHLRNLSHDDVQRVLPHVRALQQVLRRTGVPSKHLFWGAKIDYLDQGRRLDLEEDLSSACDALKRASEKFEAVSQMLLVDVAGTFGAVSTLKRCAERAAGAPPRDGVALKLSTWKEEEAGIRRIIGSLETRRRLRSTYADTVKDDIWRVDFSNESVVVLLYAGKWYRAAVARFRLARKKIRAHLNQGATIADSELPNLLDAVSKVRTAEAQVAEADATMARLFGVQWQGVETDPIVLANLLDWILAVRGDVESGLLPPGILDLLQGGALQEDCLLAVQDLQDLAEEAIRRAERAADLLAYDLKLGDETLILWELHRLEDWRSGLSKLADLIALNEARRQLADCGLEGLLAVADNWEFACDRLEYSFLRAYYTGVVRAAMELRPSLKTFDRATHEELVKEFQRLDDYKLRLNRVRVRQVHQKGMPSFNAAHGNLRLLKVECEKQRKHRSIRWAMSKAGPAVQLIKPVFMMSPLSVAIHLPPELPRFDLVIFDEASQIRPEDALSAIVRAKQVIVVGDTKQMPPTSFFERVLVDDDYDEEEGEESSFGREAAKLESILNLMSAVIQGGTRRPDLRWHYRSVHQSLIQPSNELFYDNRLIVFPSANVEADGQRIGVVFHHLPDAIYEPGSRKRFNKSEANEVAGAVHAHVRTHPEQSLMVAAMNKQQADLIYDEVMKLEREDPASFQRFRSHHPYEPLEIKNLENVQGDERDVVFISITYGRDESGVFRQHFGPLLREGGERRLNVLISRARRRCEVFSSITSDDIRVDSGKAGVYALQQYLAYAKQGRLVVPRPTGEEPESPFEEEVIAALQLRGYEVHPQVGSEGYRIDIGVVDPEHPGCYIIGVECDGATYHSARSARDRDKLRQRVLEARGWHLHRIWSHDWWQDKDREIQRLLDAISAARSPCPSSSLSHDDEVVPYELPVEPLVTTSEELPSTLAPYLVAPSTQSWEGLVDHLVTVVRVEGPIHHELLIRRLRDAKGVARTGNLIRGELEELIQEAVSTGRIRFEVDGYFVSPAQLVAPRDWSTRPPIEKQSNLVSEVEIAAGLRYVVQRSFGIDRKAAAIEVFRLMGFRVSQQARERGEAVVARMLDAGGLREEDGHLYPK